jgi:hypothetical protein
MRMGKIVRGSEGGGIEWKESTYAKEALHHLKARLHNLVFHKPCFI